MEMCLDSRYVYENWATYQSINAEETIQRVQTGFSEAFYGKFIGLQVCIKPNVSKPSEQ